MDAADVNLKLLIACFSIPVTGDLYLFVLLAPYDPRRFEIHVPPQSSIILTAGEGAPAATEAKRCVVATQNIA